MATPYSLESPSHNHSFYFILLAFIIQNLKYSLGLNEDAVVNVLYWYESMINE